VTVPLASARMLSLPLRITPDGQLERTDAVSSLLGTIQAMAATSRTAWPHAPWFGLQELFSDASMDLQDHPRLATALNAAFAGLGVTWARVSSVRRPQARVAGERNFDITLMIEGQATHGQVTASTQIAG
jgi:hypothetical protein